MRLHPFAGKSMRRPMAVIQIPTKFGDFKYTSTVLWYSQGWQETAVKQQHRPAAQILSNQWMSLRTVL